ncbi:hypothetical protein BHE74_00015763 [Ensete ventricosum]|nr:hypothetical protein GW17_00035896 [Ensete ventricosum]RWW76164.1 hypothetical protein BHE74_00015763 [Ensete ventricosum]
MSFNLTFDVEVILIVFTTPWVESFDKCISEEGLRVKLDLINEVKAEAHLQAFRYKRAMARFYDCEVRLWKVRIEDCRGQSSTSSCEYLALKWVRATWYLN